jgi:hypothetical protein
LNGRSLHLRRRLVGGGLAIGTILAVVVGVVVFTGSSPERSRQPPIAGNPNGHFTVPSAGQAVNTSHPNHVVGNGTPASCTSTAVVRAVAAGGVLTFDCGAKPVTIVMASPARVNSSQHLVVLDGGGRVTLSGGGRRRILFSDTCPGPRWTGSCVNQPNPQIVVQNITFADGYNGTPQTTCTANRPACAWGGVSGGGAIYVEGGRFKAVDSRFTGNSCYPTGPDLGGGAIRALAQYDNEPVYITDDTFADNHCSNGGALSSISVQWDILNSSFTDNSAIGRGANPAAPGTPGGGSGGAIYLDGKNDNALIAGTVMSHNTAREGGGALFDVVDSGYGAATFDQSQLSANTSGRFETSPGVYYQVDGHDRKAARIATIVN